MKIRLFNILILSGLVVGMVQAQDAQHGIRVIARSYGDSIVLRWAPTTPVAWQVANANGYYIARYLLMKDSVLQENIEPQLVIPMPLRPWPLEKWRPYEKDQYAAIAAQALYGKTFRLNTGRMGTDVSQIYQKSKETELRHSFAMLAADISQGASVASALRFTDHNVKPGERYVYKVYTRHDEIKIDTGFYYIGTNDRHELPMPYDVQASVSKGVVTLTWNKAYFHDVYTAYTIERSDDGKTFFPVSALPFINTYRSEQARDRGIFTDSLPALNRKFFYRVKGINAFAETGPPSDTVEVVAVESLRATPVIAQTQVVNNNEVHIRWEFPQEEEKALIKFQVERAAHAAQGFSALRDSIAAAERTYVDTAPLQTGYYRVRAIGLDGSELVSLTHMVQRIDSIPPAMPHILSGVMDTTGVVTLTWKSNTESDLLGYRIFRANFASDEFFQISSGTVSDTVFYDTLSVDVLSSAVYYKIAAVDYNGNRSDFSPLQVVERYDNIPPVAPLFRGYQSSSSGIVLSWIPSSSDDVVKTILKRRIKGHTYWRTVATFLAGDTARHYYDKDVVHTHGYEYMLQAIDQHGLASTAERTLTVRKVDSGLRPPIEQVRAVADRRNKHIKLEWVYEPATLKFHIYRQATGEAAPTWYTTLDGSTKVFTDQALTVGTDYTYRIKAVCQDGGESPFSDLVSVNY